MKGPQVPAAMTMSQDLVDSSLESVASSSTASHLDSSVDHDSQSSGGAVTTANPLDSAGFGGASGQGTAF